MRTGNENRLMSALAEPRPGRTLTEPPSHRVTEPPSLVRPLLPCDKSRLGERAVLLKSAEIRIALILCFGIAAALSPDVGGWPWIFDGWLWTGFRDLPIRMPPMIPLLLAAAMAIADCAGAALPDWKVRVRRPLAWAAAVVLIAGCLLWTFRVRRWFGDLVGVDTQPLWGYTIEPAEPLGMLVTYLTAKWSAAHGLLPSTGIAAVTAVFGAAAVGAIFLWAQSLTASWPLPFLMMLSSGFMILFFGYPEKGTPKSLALVPWYLYLGTRGVARPRPPIQRRLERRALGGVADARLGPLPVSRHTSGISGAAAAGARH